MSLHTRFTDIVGCDVPIQLAGMGMVATPALAAAVSAAGGLGMLGVASEPLADRLEQLDALGAGPYGINFLGPFLAPAEIDIAAGRVRVVELFWLAPDAALVERIHNGGSLASWQVGSIDEAKAAVDAGCDLVVVQGVEAGGHVRGTVSLLPLLASILDAVDGLAGDQVAVVAAGGIGTARAMAAALAAGADAVRVGTRFIATLESQAHDDYKAALVGAGAEDTMMNEEFGRETGWPDAPNRVLRSCFEAALSSPPGPDRFSTMPPVAGITGNVAAMAMYAGQSVAAVTGIPSAADVVRELASGAEALLRR